MQKCKSDLKVVVVNGTAQFVRANDIVASPWNDRYVCACAAE